MLLLISMLNAPVVQKQEMCLCAGNQCSKKTELFYRQLRFSICNICLNVQETLEKRLSNIKIKIRATQEQQDDVSAKRLR